MSNVVELRLLKQRIAELEEIVGLLDRAQTRQEEKLRDKFAASAMQGQIIGVDGGEATDRFVGEVAAFAYLIADAMLLARGEKCSTSKR